MFFMEDILFIVVCLAATVFLISFALFIIELMEGSDDE